MRLPILASSGTTPRGGNLRIGLPRQVPGAGQGNLGASGQERGASGRLSVAFGGSANLFSHSVLPFFLTRGRQHLCAAKPKSILPVLVSRRPAASALHTALEGTF